MSSNIVSDELLSKLCDIVENTLEEIVIQFRGHFFEEGMEEKLGVQFEARLSTLIAKKGSNFDNLSSYQHDYVQNRIMRSLELFKKEYES
jgi:hypothetical protein